MVYPCSPYFPLELIEAQSLISLTHHFNTVCIFSHQVQQRGIPATQSIISEILQGVDTVPNQPVLIVDLLPTRQGWDTLYGATLCAMSNDCSFLLNLEIVRFAEWGFASWAMQLERLSAEDPTSTDLDLRFLAVYHSDSAAELSAYENSVKGKMMADWWDKSTVAGPKARPQTSFTEALPTLECLSVVDGEIRSLRYMSVKHVVAI